MKLVWFCFSVCLVLSTAVRAEDVLSYLTDKNGQYIGPTVEENVIKMDTDKNGFADVDEVRAFLQKMHGIDYEKGTLDRWLVASKGHSCSVELSKDLTK